MADGSSGLSLSEMGISTVKKSAKVVQKTANPFLQGAKQQLSGTSQQQTSPTQKPHMGSTPPPAEGTVFDIFSQVKQQVTGGQQTQKVPSGNQQGGTLFTPSQTNTPGNKPFPSADFGNPFGEKNPFGQAMQQKPMPQSHMPKISEEELARTRAEEKQKIDTLRQKLFDEYKQEFLEKAEGKKQQGEETLEQRQKREEQEEAEKERKKQEEEQKMAFIAPPTSSSKMPGLGGVKKAKSAIMNLLKPKQGSKEGRAGKG